MGKDKLRRFAENLTFECMVQPAFEDIFRKDHPLKGNWCRDFFGNDNPIVLELGCGRGEYAVELARKYPEKNFIGVDIKGARMWRGAKSATEEGLKNIAFLRTRIEFINSFFAGGEVSEIWITFPDPQLSKNRIKKRLTAPAFLGFYCQFLAADGVVHLKTDSAHLHNYTLAVAAENSLPVFEACDDIYGTGRADDILSIRTAYESRYLERGIPITYMRFGLGDKTIFSAPIFTPDESLK